MPRLNTPVTPFYYARAIAIVKRSRGREKHAMKMWAVAEEKSTPLWDQNSALKKCVTALEDALRNERQTSDKLRERLEAINSALSPAPAEFL